MRKKEQRPLACTNNTLRVVVLKLRGLCTKSSSVGDTKKGFVRESGTRSQNNGRLGSRSTKSMGRLDEPGKEFRKWGTKNGISQLVETKKGISQEGNQERGRSVARRGGVPYVTSVEVCKVRVLSV